MSYAGSKPEASLRTTLSSVAYRTPVADNEIDAETAKISVLDSQNSEQAIMVQENINLPMIH